MCLRERTRLCGVDIDNAAISLVGLRERDGRSALAACCGFSEVMVTPCLLGVSATRVRFDFIDTQCAEGITPNLQRGVDWTMVLPNTLGGGTNTFVQYVRCRLAVYADHQGERYHGAMAGPQNHVVFVVDDDRRIRESLAELLSSCDMHAVTFSSAAEYLAHPNPDVPACLVLDVQLPDINGLDLQSQIRQGSYPPIVFITGHGDIPSSVRAIKAGAVDFLAKPFKEADLMRAINAALAQSRENQQKGAELTDLQLRLSSLTPREREVLPLIVSGLLNKQAAADLGISEVTLQIHRGKVMKKMGAGSLAELVRMAAALEIPVTRSRHSKR